MINISKKPFSQYQVLNSIRRYKKHCDNIKNCPEELKPYCRKHSKRVGKDESITYYNCITSFDIETTNLYSNKDGKNEAESATMYVWQFGFMGKVCLGRTWEEFYSFMRQVEDILGLNTGLRLVTWVHNLSYEWSFINKFFTFDDIFARNERKPIKASTSDGFEFRCTYALSNSNLKTVGSNLLTYNCKKGGDFDYNLLRGTSTPLTRKEVMYCVYDCLVVNCYIVEVMRNEKCNISTIRMTKTGEVRNIMKKMCLYGVSGKDFKNTIKELTLGKKEYYMLKEAFAGGMTHADFFRAGEIIEDIISNDFTSSYPYVLCSEKFPMGKGELSSKMFSAEEIMSLHKMNRGCIFNVTFKNIRTTSYSETPISISKCRDIKKAEENNGRLIKAKEITMTLTDVDLRNFERFYTWDKSICWSVYVYKMDYLPKQIIYSVLSFYGDKTKLKDVVGEEVNYALGKERVNSIYGMMVTDFVYDKVYYSEMGWDTEQGDVDECLDRYNTDKNRTTFYPWGVYCTSYARYNLCTGIKAIDDKCKELGVVSDYVYADTDSIKFSNPERHMQGFEDYNKEAIEKLEACLTYRNIDLEMYRPKTVKGKEKILGVWDFDGHYKKFKTVGAKRYMYTDDNNELHITVAGTNKKAGAKYLSQFEDPFEEFSFDLTIPEEHSGRLSAHYIDESTNGSFIDYLGEEQFYSELSCVVLTPSEFTLKHADVFEKLINLSYEEKINLIGREG